MVTQTQYVRRSRSTLGPTLYAASISGHLYWSRASYYFYRYRNILCSNSSIMALRFCRSLASRAAVPIPRPARNPWVLLWNQIANAKQRFRRPFTVFYKTSTWTIPWKSPKSPFGIRNTVCHVLSVARVLFWKYTCMMDTTLCQLMESDASSHIASPSHLRR